jgi:hypothetical protein
MMSLFSIVHILQLAIFENMLAYENVNSYIFSIAYAFEQAVNHRKHQHNDKAEGKDS